jgi:NAD(P)-dependent dehydrogenase (short-subunit alcohol dehydrogenase family)
MLHDNRVVIVSGIGPGVGRELALAFAREGAKLVLGSRTEKNLADVGGEVEEAGRPVTWRQTDITRAEDCEALVAHAVEEFGRVDVLVNNAFRQPPLEPIAEATDETWQKTFGVNVFGSAHMTNAAIAQMKQQQSGSIVFVASMSARRVRPDFGVYSASKAALLTAARHYANEHGRDGIRVNSIVPGYVWGPSLELWFAWQAKERGVDPQVIYDEVASENAMHHLPTAAEVADTAVMLASDLARAVTGQSLDVNAGHWFA